MDAHHIGRTAAKTTLIGGDAKVIGVTSRGVFLVIVRRVLFVSFEHWRGPLTINVDTTFDCSNGDPVRLSATRLIFPATEIDLSTAEVWQPTVLAFARSITQRREPFKQLALSVLTRTVPDGFGSLLPHLLDLPEKQALSAGDAAVLARLHQLRKALGRGDFAQVTSLLQGLLGLGRGLTPSGDDVIIGLFLLLGSNKHPSTALCFAQAAFLARKNALKRVVESAYQRTTLISANLIERAANGEADERLLNVVAGLVTGTPSIESCANCVLEWGSSSGIDALVGMAITL